MMQIPLGNMNRNGAIYSLIGGKNPFHPDPSLKRKRRGALRLRFRLGSRRSLFLLYLFHSLAAAKFFGNKFTIGASYSLERLPLGRAAGAFALPDSVPKVQNHHEEATRSLYYRRSASHDHRLPAIFHHGDDEEGRHQ